MNSEELEISLKAEFESHLNDVFSSFRQKTDELEKSFDNEFAKHRSQIDEAVKQLKESFAAMPQMDSAMQQSIAEHLRLAKDSGAQLAATAFDEAEKLRASTEQPTRYDLLRDAIAEVSTKTSQSTILTSLVLHAGSFAPRGVFFILKNEQFICWKRFGRETGSGEQSNDLRFPSSDGSVLSRAVDSLKTAEAQYSEGCIESSFLSALGLGTPGTMHAIPLTARGRGVAVLYVDDVDGSGSVNIEALESLVRVAGLTVELLAASHMPNADVSRSPAASKEQLDASGEPVAAFNITGDANRQAGSRQIKVDPDPYSPSYANNFVSSPSIVVKEEPSIPPAFAVDKASTSSNVTINYDAVAESSIGTANANEGGFEPEPFNEMAEIEPVYEIVEEPSFESDNDWRSSEADVSEVEVATSDYTIEYADKPEHPAADPTTDFAFAANGDSSAELYSSGEELPETGTESVVESAPEELDQPVAAEVIEAPPSETLAAEVPRRPTYAGRNMDLPIEVPEEERRMHNDARRFARLLVSEIKLYNEQKVNEGRDSHDLYDRLREAIDRSREMYEKRVQPAVASKFDYFHFELVNDLAEGDVAKLGGSYQPPPRV